MSAVAVPDSMSCSLVIRLRFCLRMDTMTPCSGGVMGGMMALMRVPAPMKLSTRGDCASSSMPPMRTMRLTMSSAASGEAKASLS